MSDLYTFIAHQSLAFANPFSEATMDRAAQVLNEECLVACASGRVIDFGAGFCELPIRLAERYGAEVVAVELGARMAATARERIAARLLERKPPLPRGGVNVHEGDAGRFRAEIPDQSFDAAICIGSSHALGGYHNMLSVLARLTKPGGCVLVGEGFWERAPSPSDLVGTDVAIDEFAPLGGLFTGLRDVGLHPLWSVSATSREWDEYEWAHHRALEAFAAKNPTDPDAIMLLKRGRLWRRMYLETLRGMLGFGLILARRDSSS